MDRGRSASHSKLRLRIETLRNLSATQLAHVGGASDGEWDDMGLDGPNAFPDPQWDDTWDRTLPLQWDDTVLRGNYVLGGYGSWDTWL